MKYEEIKAKTEIIVNNPIRHFKPVELKGIIDRYHQKHPKSKEIYERMLKTIPGGVNITWHLTTHFHWQVKEFMTVFWRLLIMWL